MFKGFVLLCVNFTIAYTAQKIIICGRLIRSCYATSSAIFKVDLLLIKNHKCLPLTFHQKTEIDAVSETLHFLAI
jgi:L-cystine uptake protein TcyP (sodium:dicarboxylate symporter family)